MADAPFLNSSDNLCPLSVAQISEIHQLIWVTGDFLLEAQANFRAKEIESKSTGNLVSRVDREAETQLQTGLSKIFPGSGFIMEESGSQTGESEYVWIIDPLDGTTNFVHGLPAFTISIGLVKNPRELFAGWVFDPHRKELFFAQKDKGAWVMTPNNEQTAMPNTCGNTLLKKTRIYCSKARNLSDSLIAMGFPYSEFGIKSDYLSLMSDFQKATHGVRRLGSAALDLAWVACGRFDGFYEIGLNSWDVAGGALLIQEAGGRVTDFMGGDNFLFGRQIVSCNTHLHSQMLGKVQKYYPCA